MVFTLLFPTHFSKPGYVSNQLHFVMLRNSPYFLFLKATHYYHFFKPFHFPHIQKFPTFISAFIAVAYCSLKVSLCCIVTYFYIRVIIKGISSKALAFGEPKNKKEKHLDKEFDELGLN